MRILSVASAFPKHYYPQEVLTQELKKHWGARLENPAVIDRLGSNVKVAGRHLALPLEEYERLSSWGQANNEWIKCAEELGQSSVCRAITQAGYGPTDLDALLAVSVTGIASPSLDARLINRMHLRRDLKRMPIFGLGCVAGAAGIARAADYVHAYPDQIACLLCVELCSLTWQRDDLSMANLISAGLFGDGAVAVVVAGENVRGTGPRILASRSIFYPDTEDMMGWDISEKGFRIVLSPKLPELIKQQFGNDVETFLKDHQLSAADIGCWILHPGGPKVLNATAEALRLPKDALAVSWECLRRVGNLSSASVLLVLEHFMKRRRPTAGTFGLLAAMGPGFCSELVLLQW